MAAEYSCAACRTPFVTPFPLDEAGLCGLCRRGMNGFDGAYSYGFYEGTLQKLIHLYKYAGVHTLSRPLAAVLSRAMPRREEFDFVTAVPMHWWKRWRRGFNQSELLTRELSKRTGIPMESLLRKTRPGAPQAGLSDSARRRNVAGSFSARSTMVDGSRVLLVDDVLTTGATASACALALKRAGAVRVSVLTLARADRRVAAPPRPDQALAKSADGGRK